MKKLFALFTIILACTTMVFAQKAKSVGITDNDVQVFGTYYEEIIAAADIMEADEYEAFLKECGMTGPSRTVKVISIISSLSFILIEEELDSDPDTEALLILMGVDLRKEMKKELDSSVGAADYKVVKKNLAYLDDAMEYLNAGEEDSDDSSMDYFDDWDDEYWDSDDYDDYDFF